MNNVAALSTQGAEKTGAAEYSSIWLLLADQDFSQRWLDVDGVRTRVMVAGPEDAPAVVMLHGTGGHWETFAPTIGVSVLW